MKKRIMGFSLLELIIVIIVISILAAISLPVFTKLIDKNRQVEAINMLTRMYQGYKDAIIDEAICATTGTFSNGSTFNPDEDNENSNSEASWEALGFDHNPNLASGSSTGVGSNNNGLFFSYDFLNYSETPQYSSHPPNRVGTAPSGDPSTVRGFAYRKIDGTSGNGYVYDVNFTKNIWINMNTGEIHKSPAYQ